jgi:hypothetical protein
MHAYYLLLGYQYNTNTSAGKATWLPNSTKIIISLMELRHHWVMEQHPPSPTTSLASRNRTKKHPSDYKICTSLWWNIYWYWVTNNHTPYVDFEIKCRRKCLFSIILQHYFGAVLTSQWILYSMACDRTRYLKLPIWILKHPFRILGRTLMMVRLLRTFCSVLLH